MIALKSGYRVWVIALLILLCVPAAVGKKKEQPKAQSKAVDAGSFGIFVQGKRIATETFRIEQQQGISTDNSEFKTEEGMEKVRQSSELQFGTNGQLRRYSWRESIPGKAELTVEPSGEFLMEHVVPVPPEKPSDQPLLLSTTTTILDDYFFSHRELLIWKYLAQGCGMELKAGCSLPRAVFGALVPRQRTSVSVAVEYKGKETVDLKGAATELDRFELSVEGDEWRVYLDREMKMVKIVVPGEHTEVVRD